MHRTAFGAVQVSIRHEMCWFTGYAVSGCLAPTKYRDWVGTERRGRGAGAGHHAACLDVRARQNPSYRDYERSASPLPHGTQCGASVTPPCHCEAQPKQSGGIKKEIATPLRGLAMTNGQGRAMPLHADSGGMSLRGAAEAIWQFSKEGLPRPLRGLAMTGGQGRALPLRA